MLAVDCKVPSSSSVRHKQLTWTCSTPVHLPVVPERNNDCPATLHRLCFPIQAAHARLSRHRRAPAPGQATHGIRARRPLRPRLHLATGTLVPALPHPPITAPYPSPGTHPAQLPREPRLERDHAQPQRPRQPLHRPQQLERRLRQLRRHLHQRLH